MDRVDINTWTRDEEVESFNDRRVCLTCQRQRNHGRERCLRDVANAVCREVGGHGTSRCVS